MRTPDPFWNDPRVPLSICRDIGDLSSLAGDEFLCDDEVEPSLLDQTEQASMRISTTSEVAEESPR